MKKEILIIGGYGFLGLNIIHHFHNYFELTIAVKKSSIRPEINLPLKYKIVYTDNDDFFSIFKVKQFSKATLPLNDSYQSFFSKSQKLKPPSITKNLSTPRT